VPKQLIGAARSPPTDEDPAVRGGKESAMAGITTGPMAGKTVLVTGGTGGIGKATAIGLAAAGATRC
jgi:NADPH:quinone reductase-like Zn-dependent oxidoreductase